MLPGYQPGNKCGKKKETKTGQVPYAIGIIPNELEEIGNHYIAPKFWTIGHPITASKVTKNGKK